MDLGRSVTSLFFNKTRNKKVSQKGLSTQNRCHLVLVLKLVPFTPESPAHKAARVSRGAFCLWLTDIGPMARSATDTKCRLLLYEVQTLAELTNALEARIRAPLEGTMIGGGQEGLLGHGNGLLLDLGAGYTGVLLSLTL